MILLFIFLIIIILSPTFISGGNKDSLYAGLYKEFTVLEPRKSNAFEKPVVFATNKYLDAVLFCASWSYYDFEFGYFKNKGYLVERYPGALNILNTDGYIHYLDIKDFHKENKLPPSMMISYNEIRPKKCVKINVIDEAKKTGVKIITNEELLEKMHVEKRDIKINEMYVPIDFNWKPEIEGAEYFYDFRDIFEPVDKVIVNNFDGYNCRIIEYDCKKKYLVIPKSNNKENSDFTENMLIIYKDYEKLFI